MKLLALLLCVGVCWAVPLDPVSHGVVDDAPFVVLGTEELSVSFEYEPNPEESPSDLFEGDIDLLPGENPLHRNAIGDRRRRWNNGVLPYEIQANYPQTVKTIFMDAMNEIETKTMVNGRKCITFTPRQHETAYVHFVTGTGCHTPVGFINRESQVTIGHGCERKGTVMHELLHAIGFWHEQSRTDRDNYVTIHLDNVQKGHEGNFNKYPVGYIDMLGQPYDYGSIMHYSAYAFAIDNHRMTIEPKQPGVTIGQRLHLSDTDIKEIQLLYDCIQPDGSSGSGFVTAPPATTAAPPQGTDVCTFETDMCSWTNSRSDQTDWVRHAGTTPSAGTGPHTDPHGSTTAHYLYIEASSHTGQHAILDSKSYPGGDYCVDFYFHMYGNHMGQLNLNVHTSTQTIHMKTWSGDHGDHWMHARINAHVHTTGSFQFEIEGITGTDYHSDLAIDDIQIHAGSC